jgi:ketopantoate reductase
VTDQIERILVYGAGPLGSLLAARLHEAGHDVAILARGDRLAQIKGRGIVLEDEESGQQEVAHVPVVETLDADDHYDLVMVVMRHNHVDAVLPTLAANRHVPTVLFMMNNAHGAGPLVDALGQDRVLLGFPLPGGSRDGDVVRIVPVDEDHPYTLPIGEVDGVVRARTRTVAEVLSSMRGYDVEIRDDMEAWLKYHACVTILALGPAVCAAGIDMERLARTRDLQLLALRAMKQGFRGLRKDLGLPPSPASFRALELLPEPVWVWLLSRELRRGRARSSIEGHSAAARDEVSHVGAELLSQLQAAGSDVSVIEQLLPYAEPDAARWPDGSRELPMRWADVAVPTGALLTAGLGLLFRRRRRSRRG